MLCAQDILMSTTQKQIESENFYVRKIFLVATTEKQMESEKCYVRKISLLSIYFG